MRWFLGGLPGLRGIAQECGRPDFLFYKIAGGLGAIGWSRTHDHVFFETAGVEYMAVGALMVKLTRKFGIFLTNRTCLFCG